MGQHTVAGKSSWEAGLIACRTSPAFPCLTLNMGMNRDRSLAIIRGATFEETLETLRNMSEEDRRRIAPHFGCAVAEDGSLIEPDPRNPD